MNFSELLGQLGIWIAFGLTVVIMNVALVYFELPIGAAKDSVYTPRANLTEFKSYYAESPKCFG